MVGCIALYLTPSWVAFCPLVASSSNSSSSSTAFGTLWSLLSVVGSVYYEVSELTAGKRCFIEKLEEKHLLVMVCKYGCCDCRPHHGY